VTAFDVSALPASRRIVGEVLATSVVNALNSLEYRLRLAPEYAYYQEAAYTRSLTEAGKRLAAKRDERDLLIFRGTPSWRYRRDLETVDRQIAELEEAYRLAEARSPEIVPKPDFRFTPGNNAGTFPPAPLPGDEYRFCGAQQADAFLTGKVSEFHHRIYLILRVYPLYSRSYLYEDSFNFSPEDLNAAVGEIGGSLTAFLEGTAPSAILVSARPDNALVLINGAFAGRGGTGVLEHAPGPVEVSVFADDHNPQTVTLDLEEGELAELQINLTPLGRSAFQVEVPQRPGSALYRGSLYVGEPPLTLEIPWNQYEYLSVETPEGEAGRRVIQSRTEASATTFSLGYAMPQEGKPVDRSRRGFYGAYGRFWIAMPIAYMIAGVGNTYLDAYAYGRVLTLYDEALTAYWVTNGGVVIAGGFLVESLVRMVWYIYTATRDEPRLLR
jgi:hypothetical protein